MDQNVVAYLTSKFRDQSSAQAAASASKIKTLFVGASAAVGTALVAMGVQGVKSFANLEKGATLAGSVMGSTRQQIQQMMDAARDPALRELGIQADTMTSAFYHLGSAGLDTAQTIAAAGAAAVGAKALLADVGDVSRTVAATMKQMGLEAGDAGRIMDVFVGQISSSPANLQKVETAFRQGGQTAKEFGLDLITTAAAFDVFFQKGAQGEQAGTLLRNFLAKTAELSGEAKDSLNALGLTMDDVNVRTLGLGQVLDNLKSSGIDVTDVIKIFGAENANLIGLINEGSEGLAKEAAAIEKNADAKGKAITQTKTLAGSFEIAKTQVTEFATQIGSVLSPAIKTTLGLFNEWIGYMNRTDEALQSLFGVKGKIDLAEMVGGGPKLQAQLNAASAALERFGSLRGTFASTPSVDDLFRGLNPAVVEQLTANVKELSSAWDGNVKDIAGFKKGLEEIIPILEANKEKIDANVAANKEMGAATNSTADAIRNTLTPLEENRQKLEESYQQWLKTASAAEKYDAVLRGMAIVDSTPTVDSLMAVQEAFTQTAETAAKTWASSASIMEGTTKLLADSMIDDFSTVPPEVIGGLKKITGSAKDMTNAIVSGSQQMGSALASAFKSGDSIAKAFLKTLIQVAAQLAVIKAMQAGNLLGAAGVGFLGSFFGGLFATGGPVKGYATGGQIPGYAAGGSIMPPGENTLLAAKIGEYVHRIEAVNSVGKNNMDSINNYGAMGVMMAAANLGGGRSGGGNRSVTVNMYDQRSFSNMGGHSGGSGGLAYGIEYGHNEELVSAIVTRVKQAIGM